MIVTTVLTDQIPIPHEPNEWMRFRKLSWKQLEAAALVQFEKNIAFQTKLRQITGPPAPPPAPTAPVPGPTPAATATSGAPASAPTSAPADATPAAVEPTPPKVRTPDERLGDYDKECLLREGIGDWSYHAKNDDGTPGEKIQVMGNTDKLDKQTAKWAALQILDLSAPAEDDAKN